MAKTIYRNEYRLLLKDLRRRREAKGLSQAEVAGALGWNQRKLSYAETGARRLDVVEYIALAQVLGFSPYQAFELAHSRTRRRKPKRIR